MGSTSLMAIQYKIYLKIPDGTWTLIDNTYETELAIPDATQALLDYYSIFSIGGSSGSMVLNYRGELIGMIVAGSREMPIAVGPRFYIFRNLFSLPG